MPEGPPPEVIPGIPIPRPANGLDPAAGVPAAAALAAGAPPTGAAVAAGAVTPLGLGAGLQTK